MSASMANPHSWSRIRACPLDTGSFVACSHRLLHWGSNIDAGIAVVSGQGRRKYKARIALTCAFAEASFEKPYFSDKYLPMPPIALRIGLVSGQLVQYEHHEPKTKHELAMLRRLFYRQKKYFNSDYFEKIGNAIIQWKMFMGQHATKRKKTSEKK